MRSLLALKTDGISFANDPESLALLLYGIVEKSRGTGGIILVGEVTAAARDIGYRGPISSTCRLLLAQGFLSEHERGSSFSFREKNRAAVRQFFLEHEHLFSGARLSDDERVRLFDRLVDGSDVEKATVRIMRLLAALLVEFGRLSHLESEVRAGIAREEAALAIASERGGWLVSRMDAVLKEAETAQPFSTFDGQMRFARAVVEASDIETRLHQAIDEGDDHAEKLHSLARQEEHILFLRAFESFLSQFARTFVSKEGGE